MTAPAAELDLRDVVAQAYRVFRHRTAPPFPLDVCLACCVSTDVEEQLRTWPLERITAQQLYEYNDSAKSETQLPREIGHLLPRMLDLLSQGQEIHHSLEISLDRVGRCPEGCWNDKEQAVLDRFALAYFDAVLHGSLPVGERFRWPEDSLSTLLMFDIGGQSIEPLLAHWLHCDSPHVIVQYVSATYWDFWRQGEYTNAFASSRPAFRQQIANWLTSPDHRAHFIARLLDPAFQQLAQQQPDQGHTPFSAMVDGVSDALTR